MVALRIKRTLPEPEKQRACSLRMQREIAEHPGEQITVTVEQQNADNNEEDDPSPTGITSCGTCE